jgi:hypothetical protein
MPYQHDDPSLHHKESRDKRREVSRNRKQTETHPTNARDSHGLRGLLPALQYSAADGLEDQFLALGYGGLEAHPSETVEIRCVAEAG